MPTSKDCWQWTPWQIELKIPLNEGKRGIYNFEAHVSIHQNAHQDIQLATGMEMSGIDKV